MTLQLNPYQPPATIAFVARKTYVLPNVDKLAFTAWPVVQIANVVFLRYINWGKFEPHCQFGCAMAFFVFLVCGWFLCYFCPIAARKLILGGSVFAFIQFCPVLQSVFVYLALVAVASAEMKIPTSAGGAISSVGVFLMSLAIGTALLVCASLVGSLIGLFLPDRWLRYKGLVSEDVTKSIPLELNILA